MYEEIGSWLDEIGFPARDLYELPDSPLRFPDGAHWRVEIAGVERLSTLELLLNEKEKQNVPVHRLICTLMGSTYLTREELKEFAKLANQAKVETVISPGPRAEWEVGSKSRCTPEGSGNGGKFRGMDNVMNYIRDVNRCIDLGFRAFLCHDEGLMFIMNKLREAKKIPSDVIFKMSASLSTSNPANMKVFEDIGADTANLIGDVTLPQIAAIRKVCHIPIDLHVVGIDQIGGVNRMWDVAELARVGAPIYFKIDPAATLGTFKPWMKDINDKTVIEKVKIAKVITEIMHDTNSNMICSDYGPADLKIPVI